MSRPLERQIAKIITSPPARFWSEPELADKLYGNGFYHRMCSVIASATYRANENLAQTVSITGTYKHKPHLYLALPNKFTAHWLERGFQIRIPHPLPPPVWFRYDSLIEAAARHLLTFTVHPSKIRDRKNDHTPFELRCMATKTEFHIFSVMAWLQSQKMPITYRQISEIIYDELDATSGTVKQHIYTLGKKLAAAHIPLTIEEYQTSLFRFKSTMPQYVAQFIPGIFSK